VLAILEDDESSSTDSDAEPTDLAARSSSSSSSSSRQQQVQQRSSGSAAPGPPEKLQALAPGGEAGIEASSMQQQQVRLVNVNNRLVSEDTVLSDGDLVILARERIKI
jgi:hypothetical protein